MFKVIVYWICLRVSVQRPLSFHEFAYVGVYMRLSLYMKKRNNNKKKKKITRVFIADSDKKMCKTGSLQNKMVGYYMRN